VHSSETDITSGTGIVVSPVFGEQVLSDRIEGYTFVQEGQVSGAILDPVVVYDVHDAFKEERPQIEVQDYDCDKHVVSDYECPYLDDDMQISVFRGSPMDAPVDDCVQANDQVKGVVIDNSIQEESRKIIDLSNHRFNNLNFLWIPFLSYKEHYKMNNYVKVCYEKKRKKGSFSCELYYEGEKMPYSYKERGETGVIIYKIKNIKPDMELRISSLGVHYFVTQSMYFLLKKHLENREYEQVRMALRYRIAHQTSVFFVTLQLFDDSIIGFIKMVVRVSGYYCEKRKIFQGFFPEDLYRCCLPYGITLAIRRPVGFIVDKLVYCNESNYCWKCRLKDPVICIDKNPQWI